MNDSVIDHIVKASRSVRWAATAALSLLALFLIAASLNAFSTVGRVAGTPENTITVTGEGKAATIPDTADITFSVMESAPAVVDAQNAATSKTNSALAAVKKLGIADKDVKTIAYNVSPQYASITPCYGALCPAPQTSKIQGYQVSETVDVTIHDTSKAGDVLQALGSLGVQNISGPNFSVDNDSGVKNEARAAAIANAKAKADELAKELGVDLGKVVSYSENNGGVVYPMYAKTLDAAGTNATPQLPVGQNETDVMVSVTYEIH